MTLFDYPLYKAQRDVRSAEERLTVAYHRANTQEINHARKALIRAVAAQMREERA